MIARLRLIGMTFCTLAVAAASTALAANNPPRLDPREDTISVPSVPTLGIAPIAAGEPAPSGNPLWGVPLKSLSASRERPIFLPSRRPPAPAVRAAYAEPPKSAPPPLEPE